MRYRHQYGFRLGSCSQRPSIVGKLIGTDPGRRDQHILRHERRYGQKEVQNRQGVIDHKR